MKGILPILLFIHGLIHFLGFVKAFGYGHIDQFNKDISKFAGLIWLLTGLIFITSALFFLMKKDIWPILLTIAVILSQVLIFTVWADAKFGTIANMLILVMAIIGWSAIHFEKSYKKDVVLYMEAASKRNGLVTEKELAPLPAIVQKYLAYVGVKGKPKIENVRIVFEGEMREKGKSWFPFTSEQYNFFDPPTRLFFMKGKVNRLPVHGYHSYKKGSATMQIKLLSLIPVVHLDDPVLYQTETVTFFNDLCLFAPAALIDDRISWAPIDDLSVKATFKSEKATISAVLYFNQDGQLVNFVSHDRYSVNQMKAFPFSTPASKYRDINGYRLPTHGEGIWHYPDGDFVYGKFNVKSIEYNIRTDQ